MKIEDIMVPCPYHVDAEVTIDEALHIMSLRGVRHLPVVDGGELIGVVSERGLRLAQLAVTDTPMLPKVATICERNPFTVSGDTRVAEVAHEMSERRIDCALIMAPDGTLAGIFTDTDMCRLVYMMLEEMGK